MKLCEVRELRDALERLRGQPIPIQTAIRLEALYRLVQAYTGDLERACAGRTPEEVAAAEAMHVDIAVPTLKRADFGSLAEVAWDELAPVARLVEAERDPFAPPPAVPGLEG